MGRRGASTASGDDSSDRELLRRVGCGEVEALRQLHDRHSAWLAARLRRRWNDDDVVFDAIQDTFVAVWRSAKTFRAAGDPAAWLWGIASRRLIAVLRRRGGWSAARPAGDHGSIDDGTAVVDQRLWLAKAMAGLDPDQRQAIEAAYVRDLPLAQASVELGIPVGTVKTRLYRARRRLKEEL